MDDVYEVDNRYPEVFKPYEKIRGVRRHGGWKTPGGPPGSIKSSAASGRRLPPRCPP